MALIIEDGTGLVDADSYISLEEVRAYALQMGYTFPVVDETQPEEIAKQEIACRQGSLYVDLRYASRLNGEKTNPEQGMEWPRTGATSFYGKEILPNVVHGSVKKATKEAAILYYKGTELFPTVGEGPNVISKSLANGVISTTWDKDSYNKQPVFRRIDSILYALFGSLDESTSSGVKVVPINRGV